MKMVGNLWGQVSTFASTAKGKRQGLTLVTALTYNGNRGLSPVILILSIESKFIDRSRCGLPLDGVPIFCLRLHFFDCLARNVAFFDVLFILLAALLCNVFIAYSMSHWAAPLNHVKRLEKIVALPRLSWKACIHIMQSRSPGKPIIAIR